MLDRTRWQVSRGTLLSVAILAAAGDCLSRAQAAPEPPRPAAAPATRTEHPIEEPLRLLARAQQTFAGVQDYSCTLIKQERLHGTLTPLHLVTMMVRSQPFSVYLKWHQPRECVGQEACYVAGKNAGKMRAKSPGILGAVGFVSVDPDDPRAKKTSSHSITESGIGNLLNRFNQRWQGERKLNRVAVKVAEYEYNKRRCNRCELAYTETVAGAEYYRTIVYFDKELALPIRVELYDWPRQGSQAGGDLIEMYSFVNLRLNVNLPDSVFNK